MGLLNESSDASKESAVLGWDTKTGTQTPMSDRKRPHLHRVQSLSDLGRVLSLGLLFRLPPRGLHLGSTPQTSTHSPRGRDPTPSLGHCTDAGRRGVRGDVCRTSGLLPKVRKNFWRGGIDEIGRTCKRRLLKTLMPQEDPPSTSPTSLGVVPVCIR